MNEKKRVFLLMGIMGAVALIVGSISFLMLYQEAFKGQEARLLEFVQSQARMIETLAQHEAQYHETGAQGLAEAVLGQVRLAHSRFKGFGDTGEFTLARQQENQIVFLISHRFQELDQPAPVPFDSSSAEPMRLALSGKSGVMTGLDYRGIMVLAAHEPVALLNMGLVAKIDLAEIQAPFLKTGATLAGIGIILVLSGSMLFFKVTKPIIHRLEKQMRQMEAAGITLRGSESRFRTLINSNADAIVVSVSDVICFTNPAAETLFHRSAQELVGKTIGFPVLGKDSVDIEIHHPSGGCVTAAMRAAPIEWEEEPAYLISLRDVTERKAAEDKVQHLNKVISAIRNVNQLITKEKNKDRLVQGICDTLVSTRGFNSSWIALIDDSGACNKCVEAGIGERFPALKERLEQGQFPQCFQKALALSGVSVTEDLMDTCTDCPIECLDQDQASLSICLKFGQTVYGVLTTSVHTAFARDEDEKGLFQEAGEDVSFALHYLGMEEKQRQAADEQKKLEQQLTQAQKMESIGILAGGIAHDFNNILSAILGYTQIVLDEVEKESVLHDDIQEIYAGGMRAKELVKQILMFARQSDEAHMPIQMGVIAKEVLKFIRSSIPTTIDITSAIKSNSLILGNTTQVHQIFMNLFTNADHAMKDGGGILDVNLTDVTIDDSLKLQGISLKPGNYIQIKVSDTGAGIPTDIMDRIFEPYFTTKGSGEGTGMGLAVVHGIIKGYGGTITVESTVGRGSLFTVFIPVTEQLEVSEPYQAEELPSGTESILLVDDEKPIVKMGARMLEKLGYTVSGRSSSMEALELFRSKPENFDLVVTDLTMPEMTGDVLAAELIKLCPELPVILCTGYSRKVSDENLAAAGIRAVISKPITKNELAKTVRKVLDDTMGLSQG